MIQNVALITATSYIVDNPLTTNLVSKWMTQHFQSIHGAFSTTSSRKGFLFTKQIKSSKNSDHDRLLDFRLYAQGTYAVVPMEIKLSRLSVPTLIMVRVKNRPIYRAGKGNAGSVFFAAITFRVAIRLRAAWDFCCIDITSDFFLNVVSLLTVLAEGLFQRVAQECAHR